MPITSATARDFSQAPTNRDLRREAQEAIANLQFAHLFRGPGTMVQVGAIRVDDQGPVSSPFPGSNIQVQINTGRAGGSSTSVAAVRIADTLNVTGGTNQEAVIQAIRAALLASLTDGHWHDVSGSPP